MGPNAPSASASRGKFLSLFVCKAAVRNDVGLGSVLDNFLFNFTARVGLRVIKLANLRVAIGVRIYRPSFSISS